MVTNKKLLLNPKFEEEKIAGIIKKLKMDLQYPPLDKLENLIAKHLLIR